MLRSKKFTQKNLSIFSIDYCLVLTAIVIQAWAENNGVELETRHFRKELRLEILKL